MEIRGKILNILLIVAIVIAIIHISFIIFSKGKLSGHVTQSGDPGLVDSFIQLSPVSKVIISLEWIGVLVIALVILIKILKEKMNVKKEVGSAILPSEIQKDFNYGKSRTDLDLLYKVLQDRKMLRLAVICEMFKIKREVAMEWCRIMEDGNLAVIRYPTFGDPRIYISEEEKKVEVKDAEKPKN